MSRQRNPAIDFPKDRGAQPEVTGRNETEVDGKPQKSTRPRPKPNSKGKCEYSSRGIIGTDTIIPREAQRVFAIGGIGEEAQGGHPEHEAAENVQDMMLVCENGGDCD